MFGWRKRIGYIGPTVMEVVPYEFYKFAPEGVGLVGVTCNIDDWSAEWFDKALAQVAEAGRYLGSRGVDFVFMAAARWWWRAVKVLTRSSSATSRRRPACRATTGVRAAMEALRHLGARRIAIASPYPERHNRAMADYLATHGFAIAGAEGMDVPFKRLQAVTPADIRTFADGVLRRAKDCDALYLPCPQWQAAQIVDAHGARHRHPDRRLYAREFFRRLQGARHNDPIKGHGRLLASLADAAA